MRIRHSVELAAPVSIVYQLFRQPEELPRLLQSVIEVTPEEPNGVRYRVVVGDRESVGIEIELVEATPNQRIAWKQLDGPIAAGRIDFVPLHGAATRLELELVDREGEDRTAVESIHRRVDGELAALQRLLAGLARSRPPEGSWSASSCWGAGADERADRA